MTAEAEVHRERLNYDLTGMQKSRPLHSNPVFSLNGAQRAAESYLSTNFKIEKGPITNGTVTETHYTNGDLFVHYLVGKRSDGWTSGFTLALASSDEEALKKTKTEISDAVDHAISSE